nr:MAG TPA: hypothetical protein [Caudoviricetes sp.]
MLHLLHLKLKYNMFLHIFAFCKIFMQNCKILRNTVCVQN